MVGREQYVALNMNMALSFMAFSASGPSTF